MALNTNMKERVWAESMGMMPIGKTAALDSKSKPSGQSQPSSQSSQSGQSSQSSQSSQRQSSKVTRKLTAKEETTLWWHRALRQHREGRKGNAKVTKLLRQY
jgi:hypothetical protein